MCTLQTNRVNSENKQPAPHTLTTAAERADDIVEVEVAKCSNIRSNEKTVAAASVVTVTNMWVQYLSNSFGKRNLTQRPCRSSRSAHGC